MGKGNGRHAPKRAISLVATVLCLFAAITATVKQPPDWSAENEFGALNARCLFEKCWRAVTSSNSTNLFIPNEPTALGEDPFEVISAAYSLDGTRIVSNSGNSTMRLWDALSGTAIGAPLRGHTGNVLSVAYSPDGIRIVSGADDASIMQWDAASGMPIGQALRGHQGIVVSVAYSPDGSRIVSGAADGMVRQWDAVSGVPIGDPLGNDSEIVLSVTYSPDGTRIVSGGSEDGTVRQWNSNSGMLIEEPLAGHQGYVTSVAYSPDGTRIVSGSSDNTIRQWDAIAGTAIGSPLRGHEGMVSEVAYSPDGTRIVSGSDDSTVRQWDATSGLPIGDPLVGHEGWVRTVSYSPDGTHIVSGATDGTLRTWNAGVMTVPLVIPVLLLAIAINLFILGRMRTPSEEKVAENVPALISDTPIEKKSEATLPMRKIVERICAFVRNSNAAAPLTVAVTGRWGTGKSSLMRLVQEDLRNDDSPCVWFNAWHHQNETHLFASLMESIRRDAVRANPQSTSELVRSLDFRLNLLHVRYRDRPLDVITSGVIAVLLIGLTCWSLIANFFPGILVPASFVGFLGVLMSSLNPFKGFGITPASLLQTSRRAIQFPRFRDRLSFRDQFGRAFGEVCDAFGSRRLVIIVDDLDRCRPDQVVEILEAVNFLTSNGKCFVFLGIDEHQVNHAVGLHYADIAEQMGKKKDMDNSGPRDDQDDDAGFAARQAYAKNYLQKLINLRVPVPTWYASATPEL